jgi:hypothetical protein
MTDFLGSLVSRSLPSRDQTERRGELSPRLPSLYEPPNVGLGSPEPPQEVLSERIPAVTDDRPSLEMGSPSRTLVPSADAHLSQPHAERRSPGQKPDDRPLSSMEDRAPVPPAPQTVSPPVRPQIISHEPAQVIQPGAGPVPTTYSLPRLVPAPQPSMPKGRQERRLENAATLMDQPSGTTVRINIGRIEVRAVPPPLPPAQPRKTTSQTRMTIEEYAKQRNEGKR